jgi:oligopeptide/dipeptide ABC transporter ATP-binding protein
MSKNMVLEAACVSKEYKLKEKAATLKAVREVSLRIYEGESLALVGESGSGKSTLAKMMLGLTPATSGDLYLYDRPIQTIPVKERAALIQPVFQDPFSSLNPKKTIGEIVAMALIARRYSKKAYTPLVHEALEKVGLPGVYAQRSPKELSGGQRQRVAIARALISSPKLLVCDEPTSALDVSVQAQIINLLNDLRKNLNVSYLIVTHNMGVVAHLADRVAVMYLGKIVEEGPVRELFKAPRHPYTQELMSAVLPLKPGYVFPAQAPVGQSSQVHFQGCAYQGRCSRAKPECLITDPVTLSNNRSIACHSPI